MFRFHDPVQTEDRLLISTALTFQGGCTRWCFGMCVFVRWIDGMLSRNRHSTNTHKHTNTRIHPGVPYGECFHVQTRWVLTRVGTTGKRCRLQIGLEVVFRQTVFLKCVRLIYDGDV